MMQKSPMKKMMMTMARMEVIVMTGGQLFWKGRSAVADFGDSKLAI